MTNDERKKRIIMSWAKTIITIMFVTSVIFAWNGKIVWAGVLLPAFSVVSVFCNRLASAISCGLFGIGIILHGYGKEALAQGFLILGFVILTARLILTIRNSRKELRKSKIQAELKGNGEEDTLKVECAMTNDERKKAMKFLLTESICVLFLISGMACLLYEKFVWTGILFIIAGAVNIFFIPHTNVFIVAGLVLVSLGYEKRELVKIFGAVGLTIVIANTILMHKSIASGGVERLGILAKSNRFAFFNYLRENEITCILWNKLKKSN
jgi:hypothetical protein